MNILDELKDLNKEIIACRECPDTYRYPYKKKRYGRKRTFQVGLNHGGYTPGFDDPSALIRQQITIVIFGQNPGYLEQKRGFIKPFDFNREKPRHQAGRYVLAVLNKHHIPKETVYISNIVKCSTEDNHYPTNEQLIRCRHWFQKELDIIKPKIIICLGKPACWRLGVVPGEYLANDQCLVIGARHPSIPGLKFDEFLKNLTVLETWSAWGSKQ